MKMRNNYERRDLAQKALSAYRAATGEEPRGDLDELTNTVADLMTNLMHLVRLEGADVEMLRSIATNNYNAETAQGDDTRSP